MIALPLHDGRKVSYAEYGDPAGGTVLWLHGGFSSSLEAGFLAEAAADLGLRLVAPDRPGIGGSDPSPGRTVLGYAADVAEIMDALSIERAVVGGLSNGGMYSMAVASALPSRVAGALLLNATTPISDADAWDVMPEPTRMAYRHLTENAAAVVAELLSEQRHSELSEEAMKQQRQLNPDLVLLDDPRVAAAWEANLAEAARQRNAEALIRELELAGSPWGFDHRAVSVPVTIATGVHDAGAAYAKVWATELASASLVELPGGHMNILDPGVARRVVELLGGLS